MIRQEGDARQAQLHYNSLTTEHTATLPTFTASCNSIEVQPRFQYFFVAFMVAMPSCITFLAFFGAMVPWLASATHDDRTLVC